MMSILSWNLHIKKFSIDFEVRKIMRNQFFWYHLQYVKSHMLTYTIFTIFTLLLSFMHVNLLPTLSSIFIAILSYEIHANTKKFFNIKHQIIFSCPIELKTLIKKIAMSTFIKALFFLTLFFLFHFKNIWDVFVFCSFILVCYRFNILAYILKFKKRSRYYLIVLNFYFSLLYAVWYYMQFQSCLFIISVNIIICILLYFISEKIKNISFEKII